MKIEVRYLSKGGNTKKIADAIAEELEVTALPITDPITDGADILFLGGAVYGFGIDDELKKFIQGLDSSVKKVAIFSTSAIVNPYPHFKKILDEKKITEHEFHCKGKYKFMHKGKPNEADIKDAKAFARKVIG